MLRLTTNYAVVGMSSIANQPNMMSEVTTPTASDVLCGTGNANANHPGNKLFSLTISKYVEIYEIADSKKEKMDVSKAALEELFLLGVRFLKKDRVCQCWYVASEKVGRDKIGHFLRENLPNASSGSENGRRRQMHAGTKPLLPSVRPNTPRKRASSKNAQQGNLSSVWSKLDDLQDAALLLVQEGREKEKSNQVSAFAIFRTEVTPRNRPSLCSQENKNNIPNRSPFTAFFSKEKSTPLFESSTYHRMEASTPPSLKKELANHKKEETDQRCRQETPASSLADAEQQKCVRAKYKSTSQETLPSIGSFPFALSSSEIPSGVDLKLSQFSWRSSTHSDDSSAAQKNHQNACWTL
jgi:hypothetical protein